MPATMQPHCPPSSFVPDLLPPLAPHLHLVAVAAQQLHSQLQLAETLGASKGTARADRQGSGSCVESQAATLEVVAAILSSTAAHLR